MLQDFVGECRVLFAVDTCWADRTGEQPIRVVAVIFKDKFFCVGLDWFKQVFLNGVV